VSLVGIVALVVAVVFGPRGVGIDCKGLLVGIGPVDNRPREIDAVDELALGVALFEQPIGSGARPSKPARAGTP